MRRQILHNLAGRLDDVLHVRGGQDAPLAILFGIGQRGEQHGIVHVDERLGLQGRLHDHRGFVLVPRHEALVVRVQPFHRLIGEHHPQEGQRGDIFAQHAQADGQRRRQEEAHRPPQPGPEEHGHEDGHLGDPGTVAEEHGFEHRAGAQFQQHKQATDHEQLGPPGEDGEAEPDGEQRREQASRHRG